jgi:hypothetical protein
MDLKRAQAFAGLFSQNDPRFARLGPLIEEYAEDIESVIDEAGLDSDETISSTKLTLLRASLCEIDPDLADALDDELALGITDDQAQALATRLTVCCAIADQDYVARVFSALSKTYAQMDSGETILDDSAEIGLDADDEEIGVE